MALYSLIFVILIWGYEVVRNMNLPMNTILIVYLLIMISISKLILENLSNCLMISRIYFIWKSKINSLWLYTSLYSTPDCKCDMNKKGPWVKGPFCSVWEKARKNPKKGERGREVMSNKKYCYLPPASVTGKHCPGATKSEIADLYYTMDETVCKSKQSFTLQLLIIKIPQLLIVCNFWP